MQGPARKQKGSYLQPAPVEGGQVFQGTPGKVPLPLDLAGFSGWCPLGSDKGHHVRDPASFLILPSFQAMFSETVLATTLKF